VTLWSILKGGVQGTVKEADREDGGCILGGMRRVGVGLSKWRVGRDGSRKGLAVSQDTTAAGSLPPSESVPSRPWPFFLPWEASPLPYTHRHYPPVVHPKRGSAPGKECMGGEFWEFLPLDSTEPRNLGSSSGQNLLVM
jgi:hypothetical protein